jgi:hypothetical protein
VPYKILELLICILLVYHEVGCFDDVVGISSPSWTISKRTTPSLKNQPTEQIHITLKTILSGVSR